MALCAFRSCPLKKHPKGVINYYPFPTDQERLYKWISIINRPGWHPSKNDYVCHHHFPKICFINNMLKDDAIPSASITTGVGMKIQFPTDSIIGGELTLSMDKVQLKKSSFSTICRLCGLPKEGLKDIYDNELQILEKLSVCMPIVIMPNDGLPRQICKTCINHLDISFNLVQVTLTTDKRLKKCTNFLKYKQLRKRELKQKRRTEIIRLPINGPIDCDVCGQHFMDMGFFDEHMLSHKDDSPSLQPSGSIIMTCIACGFLYKDAQEYKNHKMECKSNCKKCRAPIGSKCESHTHECPKKFCYICRRLFQRKKKFVSHMERIHSIKVGLDADGPECKLCYTVHPVKPHTCETENGECSICKEVQQCPPFKKTKLPWVCKYCGKCMTTKLSLDIHERIHSGAKPYMCERCGHDFRSKSNLLQHQLTHSGERNHSCAICGKKFARKAFVRSHMRVHTGERPFECNICKHKFAQLGDMKRHRNRHLLDPTLESKYMEIEMDLLEQEHVENESS